MARVYISIGSNIDPARHVRAAIAGLSARYGPLIISSVYESEAVGFSGDNFYNLVVGFDTEDDVASVAASLQEIEERNGRVRDAGRFNPRTLDLDLLLYGDMVSDTPQLPRAEIDRYAFVLCPLAEIAGDECHPVSGERYADLWAQFDAGEQRLWMVDFESE